MRMSRQFDENIEAIDPLETMPPAKKSMVIFFLVDTSKSMEGSKLESLNRVMGDILPELIGVGEAGTDVKVAVMSFSSGCEWITPEPVLIEEYQSWENLRADGVTDLGDACEELCQKLSRNSFLRAPSLSYAPVIFLMTDGYPTDNYKKGFEMLKKNRWFQYGLKIALAIGSNVDAARLSGVDVVKTTMKAYMVSGFCSAIVGFVLCAQAGMGNMDAGNMYEMYGVAAGVIGGVSPLGGSGILLGTFAGAGVWQTLENGLNLIHAQVGFQRIIIGVIVVGAVLLDVVVRSGNFKKKTSK